MIQSMIQIFSGIITMGIIPVFLKQGFQKNNKYMEKNILQIEIIYYISVINFILIQLWYNNTDMVLGTILGSSMLQLLVMNGVFQLSAGRKNLLKSNNSKYMIVCSVILLFISGDYLINSKVKKNEISRFDGIILIALFLFFIIISYRKKDKKEKKEKKILVWNDLIKYVVYILMIEIYVIVGEIFLMNGFINLLLKIKINSYMLGLFFGAWCVNLSSIICMKEIDKTGDTNYYDLAILNTIIGVSLIIGIVAIINPIKIKIFSIYDIIILVIVGIILQYRKKDNNMIACGWLTLYILFIMFIMKR